MEYLTKEIVRDLLTTALEGGSNYWYELPNIDPVLEVTVYMSQHPLVDRIIEAVYDHHISVIVTDIETDEILGTFDLNTIARGENVLLHEHFAIFMRILNEDYDAGDADIWFQCCIMGEIVYG